MDRAARWVIKIPILNRERGIKVRVGRPRITSLFNLGRDDSTAFSGFVGNLLIPL